MNDHKAHHVHKINVHLGWGCAAGKSRHGSPKVHSAFVEDEKKTFAFCMMSVWRCREYGGC